jgi:hypothetical protein
MVARDDLARVQQELDEQRPLLGSAEGQRLAAAQRPDRPKDPVLDRRSTPFEARLPLPAPVLKPPPSRS